MMYLSYDKVVYLCHAMKFDYYNSIVIGYYRVPRLFGMQPGFMLLLPVVFFGSFMAAREKNR